MAPKNTEEDHPLPINNNDNNMKVYLENSTGTKSEFVVGRQETVKELSQRLAAAVDDGGEQPKMKNLKTIVKLGYQDVEDLNEESSHMTLEAVGVQEDDVIRVQVFQEYFEGDEDEEQGGEKQAVAAAPLKVFIENAAGTQTEFTVDGNETVAELSQRLKDGGGDSMKNLMLLLGYKAIDDLKEEYGGTVTLNALGIQELDVIRVRGYQALSDDDEVEEKEDHPASYMDMAVYIESVIGAKTEFLVGRQETVEALSHRLAAQQPRKKTDKIVVKLGYQAVEDLSEEFNHMTLEALGVQEDDVIRVRVFQHTVKEQEVEEEEESHSAAAAAPQNNNNKAMKKEKPEDIDRLQQLLDGCRQELQRLEEDKLSEAGSEACVEDK